MAWERSFEKRVLEVRDKELRWQRLNYTIEVCTYDSPVNFANIAAIDALECDLVGDASCVRQAALTRNTGTALRYWLLLSRSGILLSLEGRRSHHPLLSPLYVHLLCPKTLWLMVHRRLLVWLEIALEADH
jgi:hypothetical protein